MADLPSDPPVPSDLLFLLPLSKPVSDQVFRAVSPSSISEGAAHGLEKSQLPPSTSILPPVTGPSSGKSPIAAPWLAKLKASYQPLSKIVSPTYLPDGTPPVRAPDSISLGSSRLWKDHLVAYFHGNPPSLAKVFADLNPIWGKQGRITVKTHSKRIYLIYIPSEVIRNWVLEAGFWHSGQCSFSVKLWSSSLDLTPRKLTAAPIWVLFKNVPPELWSSEGFSTIASGVGTPVHSEFTSLKPYTNGIVKLKVVLQLESARSPLVRVTDKDGIAVTVTTSYLGLPPKCCSCGEFGHLPLRCPESTQPRVGISLHSKGFSPSPAAVVGDQTKAAGKRTIESPPKVPQKNLTECERKATESLLDVVTATLPLVKARSASFEELREGCLSVTNRPASLPSSPTAFGQVSISSWIDVVRKAVSQKKVTSAAPVSNPAFPVTSNLNPVVPITSSEFEEEERVICTAQAMMRKRYKVLAEEPSDKLSPKQKKRFRKKQRQKLYALTLPSVSDEDPLADDRSISSKDSTSVVGGQASLCSVHSVEA